MGILLVHRRKSAAFPKEWVSNYAHWQTCLREIAIIPLSEKARWEASLEAYEYHQNEEAIRSLVEICAGLHSPVLGETEVFGQFRARFLDFKHEDPAFQRDVRNFIQRVIECTKRVREQCLKGGTSSSYGSLTRRFTKGFQSASFLGAGRLAAEIIPWLEHFAVDVHARDFAKAAPVAAKHKMAKLKKFQEAPLGEVVIVVAPLEANAIAELLAQSGQKTKLVLDLRADSETNSIPTDAAERIITLQAFFAELKQNEAKRAQMLADARQILDRAVHQRERVEFRPFGWEDVCA